MSVADTLPRLLKVAAVVALGIAAGALLNAVDAPLPWVLGPLVVSAAAALAGVPLQERRPLMQGAQVVIGAAVGSGFTAGVLIALLPLVPWMIGFALWSLTVAASFSLLLARYARLDRQTALLANLPGGVAEMAFVDDTGKGASAISMIQALRVTSLVLLVPPLLDMVIERGDAATTLAATEGVFGVGTIIVLALGYVGGKLLSRAGMKNAYIVAALLIALADNMSGLFSAGIPQPLFIAAQIVIGLALGTRFKREEMRRLPRVLVVGLGVSIITSAVIIASIFPLAWMTDHSPLALILAGTPGGVAEMMLTATALGLPIAEVVAFQMVRIIIVNASAGFIADLWMRLVGPGELESRAPSK